MKRICSGCGSEIPDGSDFCYSCGAWADKSFNINDEGTILYYQYCMKCGKELVPGAEFCVHCGAKAKDSEIPINIKKKTMHLDIWDLIAILLAVIPGFFNVFGLGQIIQRRWAKAFIYLCTTGLLFYVGPSISSQSNGEMLMLIIQIGFFFVSVMDVFRGIGERVR